MKRWQWIVAVGFSLFGCASAPSIPDWVNGKSAKYPDSQYLVGRGQAGAQEEARNRARTDLAKILEAGRLAPSAKNWQPWNFVLVTDSDQLRDLTGVWQGAWHVGGAAGEMKGGAAAHILALAA